MLTIWPYHGLLGGLSHALVPSLMEFAIYHSVLRDSPTRFEQKGTHPLTENYSVLSPEVSTIAGDVVGAFNDALYEHLLSFDRIYVFGQAKSTACRRRCAICSSASSNGIRRRCRRIYILEDCMSPVPAPPLSPLPPGLDFPRLADEAIASFRAAGMHVVQSTDPL